MSQLSPFFDTVQAIYDRDHTTQWLQLFLDPTMLYSCAFFERDDLDLEQAQIAKLDLSLNKCDLKPGQTLLEIGCGWGAGTYRAATQFGVDVIALTLSESQRDVCRKMAEALPEGSGNVDIRLMGWEQFQEPVDRIVSIAAFEHFGRTRHQPFFERCREILPHQGRLLMHTIVALDYQDMRDVGLEATEEFVHLVKFLYKEIFPGGFLRRKEGIVKLAEGAGFEVERVHSLQSHYAKTLNVWADQLEANREEAIAMRSEEDFDRYMKYLTGCAKYFGSGHIDVCQFTCVATDTDGKGSGR